MQASFAQTLRDDGTYQNGGYWATPLPWLMETVIRDDPARAARYFCDAVEDFQSRKDINEWVNDRATKPRGVRDYCASAAMPLAGARRLRAFLAERHILGETGAAKDTNCAVRRMWLTPIPQKHVVYCPLAPSHPRLVLPSLATCGLDVLSVHFVNSHKAQSRAFTVTVRPSGRVMG